MTAVIEVDHLTKRYRETLALDDVSVNFAENTITGLLGRNGAGKTTLMSIITAQNFATSGTVKVFGSQPYENAGVLSRMCFVRESQQYQDESKPHHAFAAARMFFANWDQPLAESLIEEFRLPMNRTIKKLSRGQLSAVGVIIGIASRADITFFDEPYLGLDAVARQVFYDRLLADYAEHPRTIVLSSHLIDEIAHLIEDVVVIDDGRIIVDTDAESLRGRATTITGARSAVEAFTAGREVIHTDSLGQTLAATVLGPLSKSDRQSLRQAGLDTEPVSLQQLVVRMTQHAHLTTNGAAR
ncbi:ATP-binding cassette domain-containing protein [Pseudactinotalea sp.]|uniref:ATP-binding cassette domain-containing protein n=1 Tax=Pseudactinotalea sp. TaxID=1926260 RepID=UPI003B3BCCB4